MRSPILRRASVWLARLDRRLLAAAPALGRYAWETVIALERCADSGIATVIAIPARIVALQKMTDPSRIAAGRIVRGGHYGEGQVHARILASIKWGYHASNPT